MTRYSRLNRLFIVLVLMLYSVHAWGMPTGVPTEKYDFSIDMGKAYLSGILVIKNDNGTISGSLVNEFGISAMDFVMENEKVEIVSILKKLDKWYIRKILKKDMVKVIDAMEKNLSEYKNVKHGIEYRFTQIK